MAFLSNVGNAIGRVGLPSAVAAELIGGGISRGFESLMGGVSGAVGPTETMPPKATPGGGKGFIRSAGDYEAYQRYINGESFRRAALTKIPGGEALVSQLPPLLSPEEFFNLQYEQAESAAEAMSERERALAALRGQLDIEKVKQEKIGDIERAKVEQGYGLARGVLESAIENVLAKPNLAGSPVLVEAARAY